MLVPHFIENIFRSGKPASSHDIKTIDVKNHKRINKQKRLFKKEFKWAVKWTKGKRTQIMLWKKDNLQIFTF